MTQISKDAPTKNVATKNASILIVDDDDYVRESLSSLLRRRDFETRTAGSVAEALTPSKLSGIDVVLTDFKMPDADGLALVRELAKDESSPPVVVLTAYGTIASAVECLKAGASDYVLKPADTDALVIALERAMVHERRDRERRYLRREQGAEGGDPIGVSAAWTQAVEIARRAAAGDTPVLLIGETGTGKEEIARLVHRGSARRGGPFVAVNCAAIPVELFESEFFGHRRGAFTGALSDREGRLRVADGGTLFLDEINSLPQSSQAKLLRVLEDGRFERLGDSRSTRVDVRLICAANVDLAEETAQQRFRADLYYRINVATIVLPPLRERKDDIEPLAEMFLAKASAHQGRGRMHLPENTLELLRAHDWGGNVRELRNVIDRAVLLETSEELRPESLPPLNSPTGISSVHGSLRLNDVKARAERAALLEALRLASGVRKDAAELLGVDERNLAYYLRKHGLMDQR